MTEFDQMKLRRLDLGLLLVFLGLVRHGKAATVAAELGLTQSSISHALGRLRDIFGDPLFLRRPHGLEPTAVTLAIAPEISRGVAALQGALAGPAPFDPARSAATLRLSALDHGIATLLPGVVARMTQEAPGLRLTVQSLGREEALRALAENRVDLAIGYLWDLPATLIGETLAVEGYLVVGRGGHPALAAPPDPARYCAARHVVVSQRGDLRGIVDAALARDGLRREVAVSVPSFLAALSLVAESDLIATLPATLARVMAPRLGLAVQAPPVAIRRFAISAVRHRRDARNAALGWVSGLIRAEAAARMPAGRDGQAEG